MLPELKQLSFIHNLQTEISSQMNALQQRLNVKPAFPQGFPTRRTITLSCQIAAHLGHSLPEGFCGHQSRSLTGLCGHNGEHIGFEDLLSVPLRVATRKVLQLQQAYSERRQQAQQADQTIGALDLASFETASGFETLVIVFHD